MGSDWIPPGRGLRGRLFRSHLVIALIGALLLLLAAAGVTRIRDGAVELATINGPAAIAAEHLQGDLFEAMSALRGFVVSNDPDARAHWAKLWDTDIRAAHGELEQLMAALGDEATRTELAEIRKGLEDLHEWQWYISQIAGTPGNMPGHDELARNMLPPRERAAALLTELIADLRSARPVPWEAVTAGTGLRGDLIAVHGDVAQFILGGRGPGSFELNAALARLSQASREFATTLSGSTRHDAAVAAFQKELRAYIGITRGVLSQPSIGRPRTQRWLSTKAVPIAEDVSRRLAGLTHRLEAHALADERMLAAQTDQLVTALLVCVAVLVLLSVVVARRRSAAITGPVDALSEAARAFARGDRVEDLPVRLADEIGQLTESFNRMRAQIATREQELETTLDTVVDAIITTDEKGKVLLANPAVERLFGFSPTELRGQNVRVLMPEPYRAEHDGYMRNYIETGDAKVIGIGREVVGRRKDGSTFPAELAISEMFLGGERHFVGSLRDITERKEIDRMKTDFIATVSHELRTPLTSIRGSLGLLLGGKAGELSPKGKSMVDIGVRNCDRLVRLINDILDVEKIESGSIEMEMERLAVAPLIRGAVQTNLGFAAEHGVRIDLQGTVPNAVIRADRDRIIQVFTNLISNAIKFSPEGGQIELAAVAADTKIRFEVRDHGEGIPEEFRPKIFAKFAQADSSTTRKVAGTGLGLSISKAIVEHHGGRIGFETEAGVGTTFYFELSAQPGSASDRPGSTQPETFQSALVDAGGPRVLVCEDDHDVASVIAQTLADAGATVDVTFDAMQALEALDRRQYVALFLDLYLPGKDGISFIRELRASERHRELRIVVVSAAAEDGRVKLGEQSFEVIDWISKPFHDTQLEDALAMAMGLSGGERPRVLHVEDDEGVAAIVRGHLERHADVDLAVSLQAARQRLASSSYDLVLLDIGLPDGSGLDLIPEIQRGERHTPILIFSALDVPRALRERVAGALLKSSTGGEGLLRAIRSILAGPPSRRP